MFKCDNCEQITKPKEKTYDVYKQKPRKYTNIRVKREKGKKVEEFYDTDGWEIETHYKYCRTCYEEA